MVEQSPEILVPSNRRWYDDIKRRIFETIDVSPDEHLTSTVFDVFILAMILLNVAAVVLETEEELVAGYAVYFDTFEDFSLVVFTIEYILRLWTCNLLKAFQSPFTGRLRYAITPMALIDLLAILPFLLPRLFLVDLDLRFIRILRLFRLLRLLKLGRYSESLRVLGNVIKARKEDLAIAGMVVAIVLVFASSIMYLVENEAQPKAFSSILSSMWWGVATLTTVGYGDIYPVTPLGKALGAVIAVSGVGLFALPAGILASGFASELQRNSQETICPHCGKDINEHKKED